METAKTKIRAVFSGAFEHESAEAVEQYLDEACGQDAQLRQEVEQLLQAHHGAGAFLGGASPSDGIRPGENVIDLSGTNVGSYKLLEPIGEGGMGIVYLAQQNEPVKRRVAIKLIKPGMDSKQVIARFETERQALALMDHPNIAKVFDAGTTESGRPYFVMELVNGLPVTKFCDEQKLPIEARLRLFQQVCQAVQHAHQKGIIHRDLKPSNILITIYDDQPVPKVIDFGVAKATDEPLTENTFFTGFGQVVGTLEYMSPEQAQFNQVDIDTRSDIYSLGAVFYELLAGEPPFERERLKNQAFDETLRMIREQEPTKPSTKVRFAASAAQTAMNRYTTTEKLSSLIHGDLDLIVMKSLEKDRSKRYETANGLALDIQRYLDSEPVSASSPSSIYRFRKFANRNRGVLTAGLVIFATLIVGIAISTAYAIQAGIAEQKAQDERQIASENFRLTLGSLKTAYSFASHLEEEPVLEPWHREVLINTFETCSQVILRLEKQPEFASDLMELLVIEGRIHFKLGRLQSAAESASRAIAIGESTRYALHASANPILASAHHLRAAVHHAQGPADGLADLQAANVIWSTEILRPDAESEVVTKLAINLLAMAVASSDNGDFKSSHSYRKQALQVLDDWLTSRDDPKVREARVDALVELSGSLVDLGQQDRARELAQEAYDQAESLGLEPDKVARAAAMLANLVCDAKETVELAESLFDQARVLRAKLAADYPGNISNLSNYAGSLNSLAQFKGRLGKKEEAKELLGVATKIQEKLADVNADDIAVLKQLAALYMSRGKAFRSLNQMDNLFDAVEEEVQLKEQIQSKRDDSAARFGLATALVRKAEFYLQHPEPREPTKAEPLLDHAYQLLSKVSVLGETQNLHNFRGNIFTDLGRCYILQDRYSDALSAQKKAIESFELGLTPTLQNLKQLAGGLSNQALILVEINYDDGLISEMESAKPICLKAIELQKQAIELAISDVEKEECISFISRHYFILGEVHRELAEFKEAIAAYEKSVEWNPNQSPSITAWLAEVFVDQLPNEFRNAERGEHMARLALKQDPEFHNAKCWLAVALYQQGKFEQAAEVQQTLLDDSPDDLGLQSFLGIIRYRQGEFERANELLQESSKQSVKGSLYLVMAVARSREDVPGAVVTKKEVEDFFEFIQKKSGESGDKGESNRELVEEAKSVLLEYNQN